MTVVAMDAMVMHSKDPLLVRNLNTHLELLSGSWCKLVRDEWSPQVQTLLASFEESYLAAALRGYMFEKYVKDSY